ncbi:MAG: cytochrome C [Rhodomicrobium sp.]|nr:cytochrome C [Rhodomicrobium sp.]
MARLLWILFFAAALTSGARAQEGSIEAGRDYAQAICAQCHAIRKGEAWSPNLEAPPFSKIANTPGMTGAALALILRTPHREMPDLIIPAKEKADVVAYILSLKR